MNKRLILNSIKNDKPVALATCLFMAASAMLLSLSILLFSNLSDSVDRLMIKAGTPDFLQMHTGTINEQELKDFADSRSDVRDMQVLGFLNLPNSIISIGNASLGENTQDNGLCVQSDRFDLLLDADNGVIQPREGEVYVPVCYRAEYGLKTGDRMHIGANSLEVAGFLRDSQMNSMMASSKRFLISKADYERLMELGNEEYLIEFKLLEGSDVNAFATAYSRAGLPDNGPTITRPLIRMMNALSDGIMILVILLISFVVLFISILCIWTLIMTQLEKDKKEIGILKAVGISKKGIRRLYFSKYLLLSLVGCVAGVVGALLTSRPLGAKMRELYGDPGNMAAAYLWMSVGAMAAEGAILFAVSGALSRMEKLSAIEALYGPGGFGKRKSLYIPMSVITAAVVFIILVPWNIKSTIQSPGFATYMGIGDSPIRIDIRQGANTEETLDSLCEALREDERVADHVLMQTGSYEVTLPEGSSYELMIENGDHGKYPVKYTEGTYPAREDEIALSILNAREMDIKIGDELRVHGKSKSGKPEVYVCRVCGIYSDITNGGKSAKACFGLGDDGADVMWSIIYLSLKEDNSCSDWVEEYKEKPWGAAGTGDDEGIRVTLIDDYLKGTYGGTISRISNASIMSGILSCLVLFTVILLMIRLAVWRERGECSLKKALGFTSGDIKAHYLKKTGMCLLPGLVTGVFLGIVPGEALAGALLSSMGAYGFSFITDPVFTFAIIPVLTAATALSAAVISLREVDGIRAYECMAAGAE